MGNPELSYNLMLVLNPLSSDFDLLCALLLLLLLPKSATSVEPVAMGVLVCSGGACGVILPTL